MTNNNAASRKWLMIGGISFAVCIACAAILVIAALIAPPLPGSTPTSTVDVESIIMQTAEMASTQTAFVPVTSTNLPTLTQPATEIPSLAPVPTNTLVFIVPTNAPSSSVPATCTCSGDTLNCDPDFQSQAEAQACYEYCISIGVGDIYGLDGNGDGTACENLP